MPGSDTFDEARRRLHDAALAVALDEPSAVEPLLRGRLALRPQTVELAADAAIRDAAHDTLVHGWSPTELMRFVTRRLDAPGFAYARDALAATASRPYGTSWLYDLKRIDATVWWSLGRPHLGQWLERHRLTRPDGMRTAVRVLALLTYIPRTDAPCVRRPSPVPTEVPDGTLVADAKVRARVEALLARAVSSDYPDEAMQCARKAQELMARHARTPPDDLRAVFAQNPLAVARRLLAHLRRGDPLTDVIRTVTARELSGRTV